MVMTPINVLIVDDSAVVRKTLGDMLSGAPGFGNVQTAADPIFALRKMETEWPDVIVLDIEMPRMDGLTFLKKIMLERPTPVLICSSLTQAGARKSIEALALGAIDTIAKPSVGVKGYLDAASANILNSVKTAGRVGMQAPPGLDAKTSATPAVKIATADSPQNSQQSNSRGQTSPAAVMRRRNVIALGASAGGTVALERVLGQLSEGCPGIVIVQHMPAAFTGAFAERLNEVCPIEVREAVDGDSVRRGLALIAPGDLHMQLLPAPDGYRIGLKSGPPINRHRPSVDVLFRSMASCAGAHAIGVIMTGMGDDGAAGLLEMREAGAYTITQDEATSTVFGMPREAIRREAAMAILPLDTIPGELIRVSGHV